MKKLVLLISIVLCATTSFAADSYLKLGDLQGNGPLSDPAHKGWIIVTKYSLDMRLGAAAHRLTVHTVDGPYVPHLGQSSRFSEAILDTPHTRYTFKNLFVTTFSRDNPGAATVAIFEMKCTFDSVAVAEHR